MAQTGQRLEIGREGGFSRGQVKGATAKQHGSGQACHDRLGLDVEVSEEFIRSPPPADEPNAVRIDPGTEFGRGTTAGAGQKRRNRGRWNGRVGVIGQSEAEAAGDVGRFLNMLEWGSRRGGEGIDGGRRRGVDMPAEGAHAGHQSKYGTEGGMTRTSMSDGLVAHAILLACERQSGEGSGKQIGVRASFQVEGTSADPKADIAQAKQGIEGIILMAKIFSRAKLEIKPKDETFRGGMGQRGDFLSGTCHHVRQQRERQRLDAGRWVIRLQPRLV